MTEEQPEMRASDAERERVADVLREALAEGRLSVEEFQDRLDGVYSARTRGELVPYVRDLPQQAGTAGASTDVGAGTPKKRGWAERIGGTATSRWGLGIMGGFGRKGQWTVPRVFTALGIMGGGELDLRDARFEEREVVIRCFTLMGGVGIKVPPGLEVEVRGVGVMGGFDNSGSTPGDPGAPRVVVTGFTLMGGVGVVKKLPREERQELREERRRARELGRRRRSEEPRIRGQLDAPQGDFEDRRHGHGHGHGREHHYRED